MSDKLMFVIVNHPDGNGGTYDIREELILCGKGPDVSHTLLGGDTPMLGSVVSTEKVNVNALTPGIYVGDVDSKYDLINTRPATDAEILSIGRGVNPL